MWRVARVQINGGFLSGLDVAFKPGLNVLIGARGAGKTTLLELVRHATGAIHPDKKQQKASQDLIQAVLKDGEVLVDFVDGDQERRVVVDAKGSGRDASLSESIIALGQNELEVAASDSESRRALLDLHSASPRSTNKSASEEISRMTVRAFRLRSQVDAAVDRTAALESLRAEHELLLAQQKLLTEKSSDDESVKMSALQALDKQTSALVAGQKSMQVAADSLADVALALGSVKTDAAGVAEALSSNAAEPSDLAGAWNQWLVNLDELINARTAFDREIEQRERVFSSEAAALRLKAAPLRAQLEEARAGLGNMTSAISALAAQLAELQLISEAAEKSSDALSNVVSQRDALFLELEREQERLFADRLDDARRITGNLKNNVTVVVAHMSDLDSYAHFLSDTLRGSSIRQSTIDAIVQTTLPRQLLEAIENDDVKQLEVITGLASDRLQRVFERLRDEDALAELSKVTLLDTVDVRLVDGAIEKSVEKLSTGQKCAVTLPIILAEQGKSLLLDQPEDHLDNEFLVDNVVSILRSRSAKNLQTIVATHNANIPVLGEAANVIALVSNGESGSIRELGAFDDDTIVARVTTLMEGGRAAFKRRAAFYEEHGSLDS